ncbi:hypothetical protein WJX73_006957 [Symbiochloris irregularis]|uniref:Uncharacterized protein n=1 Tax=Symbiochloris irregularis TaxID=706552 RepID=A0AAW1NSJ4_9CHLO
MSTQDTGNEPSSSGQSQSRQSILSEQATSSEEQSSTILHWVIGNNIPGSDDSESEDADDDWQGDPRDTVPTHAGVASAVFDTEAGGQSEFPRLPERPAPMDHPLSSQVERHTSAANSLCAHPQVKHDDARPNSLALMRAREVAGGCGGVWGWSPAQCCHMGAFHAVPCQARRIVDNLSSRAYIGQFSQQGDSFIAAYQRDRRVRVYDVDSDWRIVKDIHCRNLRWTVTDTCLSPAQTFLLYASITPVVHMVSMEHSSVQSEANVTDIHEALHFDSIRGQPSEQSYSGFGIWSLRWAADGREVIAGTGDASVYVFDVEVAQTVERMAAHRDDVNAVTYVDDSCRLIASGSDDKLIKIWDRRQPRRPCGVLVGHTEGLTHLDPKGDGHTLISNCKDQTIKLWDLRKCHSEHRAQQLQEQGGVRCSYQWDYRWMNYPGRGLDVRHPMDCSVMTYHGHSVLRTLMRAYFSPAHTTGQRFIYTGCFDGSIAIFDVVSGEIVHRLKYHKEIVRDLSWHPFRPLLVSSSFDGSLCAWENYTEAFKHNRLPQPSYDHFDADM